MVKRTTDVPGVQEAEIYSSLMVQEIAAAAFPSATQKVRVS
jgi:hypothetical protein